MKANKDYIKGFRHGVKWAIIMAKCEVNKFDGTINQGDLGSLEIAIENIYASCKKAVQSLKEGR